MDEIFGKLLEGVFKVIICAILFFTGAALLKLLSGGRLFFELADGVVDRPECHPAVTHRGWFTYTRDGKCFVGTFSTGFVGFIFFALATVVFAVCVAEHAAY